MTYEGLASRLEDYYSSMKEVEIARRLVDTLVVHVHDDEIMRIKVKDNEVFIRGVYKDSFTAIWKDTDFKGRTMYNDAIAMYNDVIAVDSPESVDKAIAVIVTIIRKIKGLLRCERVTGAMFNKALDKVSSLLDVDRNLLHVHQMYFGKLITTPDRKRVYDVVLHDIETELYMIYFPGVEVLVADRFNAYDFSAKATLMSKMMAKTLLEFTKQKRLIQRLEAL